MDRLLRDSAGATYIEFTFVCPFLMLLLLGGIDFSLLMIDWVSLSRASYAGARLATVVDPVATGINAATAGTTGGASCFNYTDGTSTGNCTARASAVCTGAATNGTCTGGYAWNETSFQTIFTEMNKYMLFGALDRRQIQISYTPTGFGYALRPIGPPMNITVSFQCVTYPFYFLGALMHWVFAAPGSTCTGISGGGLALPQFPTTLPSEALSTSG